MQLRTARLCLDCEEVHDMGQCPVCASETFSYLVRWIPTDERRRRPRPVPAETPLPAEDEVDAYRRLASGDLRPGRGSRLLKKGVVGLAAVGIVGWLWGRKDNAPTRAPRNPAG